MYNNDFYKSLKKPSYTPPPSVFKYMWTALYLMMFGALFIILQKNSEQLKPLAVGLFCLQLILNVFWSPVFFVFQKLKLSFVVCVLLAVSVALTAFVFSKISVIAALLMIPYVLWSVFACFLTFKIMKFNL